jgi:hypothetical protein
MMIWFGSYLRHEKNKKEKKSEYKSIINKNLPLTNFLFLKANEFVLIFLTLIQSLNASFSIHQLNTNPFQLIGGLLILLLGRKTEKRLEKSIEYLTKRIRKIELDNKLDKKYIKNNLEERNFLLTKVLYTCAYEYRKELRRAYLNMLSNFLSIKYSKTRNKEFYLNILTSLTPDHLLILKKAKEYLESNTYIHEQAKTLEDYLLKTFSGMSLEKGLIHVLIKDLQSKGLLNEVYFPTWGGGSYSLYVSDAGKFLLELVE